MRGIKTGIWLWCVMFFVVSCSTVQVPVMQYKRLAVLDFKAPHQKAEVGAKAANIMISRILQTGQYDLIERSEVDQILKEHQLTAPAPTDSAALKRIGTLLKADALIVGTVSTYNVEEYKGTVAVEKVLTEYSMSVKTGQSREVTIGENGRVVPAAPQAWKPKKKHKKKKGGVEVVDPAEVKEGYDKKEVTGETVEKSVEVKAKTVLVDQIQVAKRAMVSAGFRMFDVKTGKILQAKDGSDKAYYIATSPQQALFLPANDAILEALLKRVVGGFSRWVSPSAMGMTRRLHKGKDPLTKLGVTYAKKGLWEEAVEQWNMALEANPYNPFAHNNLAVACERQGDYEAAIIEYKKALRGDPGNSTFMDNFSRARKVLSDQESAQ